MTTRRRTAFTHDAAGFTFVELATVVVLFGVMALMVVGRFDSMSDWRAQQGFRAFLNTWEFVFREALAQREPYRLVIDLDSNSYSVFREVPQTTSAVVQVDFLKNLRTRGEQTRREQERGKDLESLDEELKREDDRQTESLESLFYEFAYSDPNGNVRLARPLDLPQLAEPKQLPNGISFRDVKLGTEIIEKGEATIRFSPLGASDFAVVHIKNGEETFSAILNPSTGELDVKNGYIDYEWTFDKKDRS